MRLPSGLEAGLHDVVKDKQAYIAQKQGHHVLQKRWGYGKLAHKTKSHIDDERDHLKATLGYMAQRDVHPKMERAEVLVKSSVPEQIAAEIASEKEAIGKLNNLLMLAHNAGEDSMRRMIEHVVKDDEVHLAELERQQNLINTMGLQNYLAKVSKV